VRMADAELDERGYYRDERGSVLPKKYRRPNATPEREPMTALLQQSMTDQLFALHGATTTPERIVALQRFHGVTLRALSRASGVSLSSLHSIVTGRTDNPTLPTLRKLAAALGTDVTALLGDV